ncbi:hypothetical protein GJV11_18780 [Enterobacteriaceae bacterium RIT693]|nr:hypothetical protein [Enterobacteriaceae bacterium RIT693]
MRLPAMLKALANGINPETGEPIAAGSTANKPEAIRMLFTLVEALSVETEKHRLTSEERQRYNLTEGRSAKSHFPGTDEQKGVVARHFGQNESIEAPGSEFERSARAVAIQLEKMGLIAAARRLAYV